MAPYAFPGAESSNPQLTLVAGLWTFGSGSSSLSLSAGDPSKGIASIQFVGSGRYRVTFFDMAKLVHAQGFVCSGSPTVAPYIAMFLPSTLLASNKGIDFITYQFPSIIGPPAGDKISIQCFFTSGVKQ